MSNLSKQQSESCSGLFSGGVGIFCVLAVFFVMSQFLRVSNAVVAKELMRDLGLTAAELGTLGSAFFYAFAFVQIPLGWALDRFEMRMLMVFVPLFSTLGLLLFSMADGFWLAFSGRILCGIGMSGILMGSMKIFALRYEPSYFGTLSGVMISIGALGNMLASTPLVLLTNALGWRNTFLIVGGLIGAISVVAFRVLRPVRDDFYRAAATAEVQAIPFGEGMKLLLRNLTFWQCSGVAFVMYGTFVALQGLWSGPYLRDIRGFSAIETGNILFFLSVGRIVGSTLCGVLSDRVFKTRKWVVAPTTALYTLTFLGLNGVVLISSTWANGGLFFLIACFGSVAILLYAQLKEILPANLLGLTAASLNFFVMIGGAVIMQLLGRIVEHYPQKNGVYSPEAYYTAFWFCLILSFLSFIVYLFSKEKQLR
jgi:sugar phosphate permease